MSKYYVPFCNLGDTEEILKKYPGSQIVETTKTTLLFTMKAKDAKKFYHTKANSVKDYHKINHLEK